MFEIRVRQLLTSVVIAMGLITEASVLAAADDPLKIGFIYSGPVGDHGGTYRHDIGRKALEAEFGDKVLTTFVESIPEDADAEQVLRRLASDGYKLIFTTHFGSMDATVEVASAFPDVKFEQVTGTRRGDNISTYRARFYEGRAVNGTVAGLMTKTNVIGYIASFPTPEVVRSINATAIAMLKVNPDARIKVVWANTRYDLGKEAEAANSLIEQGADIIMQHTESPAPLLIAKERGVYGFGHVSDMKRFAPKAQLQSTIADWSAYYVQRTQAVMDGTWESQDAWQGIVNGMVGFGDYGPDVSEDVVAAAEIVRESIAEGTMHPFQGPIFNQRGAEILPEGEVLDDIALLSMDYYVHGVLGSLPK